MKRALRTVVILLVVFAGIALVSSLVADFGAADVRRWLTALRDRPALVFALVVAVLTVDSVLAVPTLATVLVAGHLLGPFWGALGSFTGMMLAGSVCYWGGRVVGAARWSKGRTAEDLGGLSEVGPAALLVARSAPMLPEVLSAMAGSGRMSARRYYLYFGLGNLPYALLVAAAGSLSTFERPVPAVVAALAVPAVGAGFVLWRRLSRA